MEKLFEARYSCSNQPHIVQAGVGINHDGIVIFVGGQKYLHSLTADVEVLNHWAHQLTLQITEPDCKHLIEVSDRQFIHLFEVYTHRTPPKMNKWKVTTWVSLITATLIGFIGLIFYVLLPAIVGAASKGVPVSYEQKIGKQLMDGILINARIDSVATQNINLYFNLLETQSQYRVNISVVKSDLSNAFALPGGYLVVYTGLLDSLPSHESMAALLAHEFGHIHLKHSIRNVFRNLAGYLIISILTGDANGMVGVIMQHTEVLQSLGYNRKLEKEADAYAIQLLESNGISSIQMIDLFEKLKDENDMSSVEWLSTHPNLEKRIEFVKNNATLLQTTHILSDSLEYYYSQITTRLQ
jgi:Zn-dependent protease with chaperone function